MVNDLLDIEKISNEGIKFKLKTFTLNNFVTDAVNNNLPYANKFEKTLETKLDPHDIKITSDQVRLTQVLNNLISNAIKFSEKNKTIEITTKVSENEWRVDVLNYGKHIPDEFGENIFDRFTQMDASDNREKGGVGLGLNICREIVEGLGGKIGYSSTPDGKNNFHILFPK